MATFHTVWRYIHYYNVGCQSFFHNRQFKEFFFEAVLLELSANKMILIMFFIFRRLFFYFGKLGTLNGQVVALFAQRQKRRRGKGSASLKEAFGILSTADRADKKKPLGELP